MPALQALATVTVQVDDVVAPTVTDAVVAVPALLDDVCRIAIVLLETIPVAEGPPHTPLIAIAVQPALQLAVNEPVNPLSVTALLLTLMPGDAED
jgi:hypothetical protein